MKDKLSIMALIAIVGVASGLVGYTFSTSESVNPATSFATSAFLSGHLELEVKDSEGNIKAYRQTDNVITNTGENCALRALFSPAGFGSDVGTTVCTGGITVPFTAIELGTGTTFEQATDTALTTPILAATDSGLAIATATTVTWTNATANLSDSAKIVVAKTFTASTSQTITEAGLFNGTDINTNGMFAHKTFAGVGVVSTDQLTVQWTINVGNSTTSGLGL